jgi:two-component system, LytTR family, response regulator
MKRLRVLIVDDEPLARRRLKRLLRRAAFEDVDECRNGEQAVNAILSDPPDLVLLDVQMPGPDGFEVIRRVGVEKMPPTVFVTAFDTYALRAFDVNAIDYLVKPVSEERLQEALRRATERQSQEKSTSVQRALRELLDRITTDDVPSVRVGPEASGRRFLERLLVNFAGQTRFLRATEIDWIEAEGNYARLHVGNKSCLIRETLVALEAMLDPDKFLRIQRSAIVNLERVTDLVPGFGGNYIVRLSSGLELSLTRAYRQRMQDVIATYNT